jgi:ABC-type lipoprotein release transport system permease subunit
VTATGLTRPRTVFALRSPMNVFTIAAIIVGILAAIFPARRAAELNPLEALHYG